jgi:PAS domain S-box-containing protein
MNMQERSVPDLRGLEGLAFGAWRSPPADFLDLLPVAIYACDAAGRILWFNALAAELWGRVPGIEGDGEHFCGSHKRYFDGRLTPGEQTPVAQVLRSGVPIRGVEGRLEGPDGSHVWAIVHVTPVKDEDGKVIGAISCFHERAADGKPETAERKLAAQALAQRMDEQAALSEFSLRLQHPLLLPQLYDVAQDAILRALDCQRAAILMFDDSGLMRFVAWRGLSETYRRAVEGHSPWARDEQDPQPVNFEDIGRSDLPDALKQTIARENIGAVAFIPIQEDGRLIGKFMAYYDAPHRFSVPQVDVALTLARQLGFSLARLHAEQARSAAERAALQLVSIVESSDDAIISKDLNGVIQTWNAAAERLFGYTADEAIGQPVTMLIPADRQDEEPGILQRLRRGERIHHYETVRQRKDGSLVDISLTVSPMRDGSGRIIGASKIARDITERGVAQRKLRESEQRLQELLTAIPAAIYTTDADGRITYFNQAAVELAGRTPTLGSDEWCVTWKLYRPDGTPLPHEECPMAVALKEGRAIRNAEAVAERPDGTRIPFIPFPTPLRDASGKVVGAINMLVDISERRQAETQQRLLLNELNHRVKNNMQILQSLLFAAARKARSDESRQVLDEASRRVAAMAAAQRVLYGTTDASHFSAEEFLYAVCQTVQQTFPSDVRVVCEAASGVLSNDMAMPLALILNELLTNAVKHGIKDRAGGTVRVGLTEQEGAFELYVEEDGEGFDLQTVREGASGLQLVFGLARQLHGDFLTVRTPSSRALLRFSSGRSS